MLSGARSRARAPARSLLKGTCVGPSGTLYAHTVILENYLGRWGARACHATTPKPIELLSVAVCELSLAADVRHKNSDEPEHSSGVKPYTKRTPSRLGHTEHSTCLCPSITATYVHTEAERVSWITREKGRR